MSTGSLILVICWWTYDWQEQYCYSLPHTYIWLYHLLMWLINMGINLNSDRSIIVTCSAPLVKIQRAPDSVAKSLLNTVYESYFLLFSLKLKKLVLAVLVVSMKKKKWREKNGFYRQRVLWCSVRRSGPVESSQVGPYKYNVGWGLSL
jgi:hypothetical protein